uniref:Uncharacterized protein n=1 Tax=Tanacetum cinerariifolium TaxID=118510 RepID=A0A6L2MZT4_TANCI|nr:hypothetical protein [Tanacetum cinerariifolium]
MMAALLNVELRLYRRDFQARFIRVWVSVVKRRFCFRICVYTVVTHCTLPVNVEEKSGGGGAAVVMVVLLWLCCCDCGCGGGVGLLLCFSSYGVVLWWLLFGSGEYGELQEFGREEFCLITGLRYGPEFSDRYEVGLIPFRRLLFDSDTYGGHVTGQMLVDNINSEEFDNLHDDVVVALCQLAVLHLTWILETYNVGALGYYTHQQRYPRVVAWSKVTTLRPDAFEAKAKWWVRSREFFDGRIHEAPPIPMPVKLPSRYDVPKYVDRRYNEYINSIKEFQKKNDAHEKLLKEVYKFYQGQSKPKPVEVRKHYELSDFDFSVLQNTEGLRQDGPKTFTKQASSSFLTWPKGPQLIRRRLRSQFYLGILPLIPALRKLRPLWHYKDLPRGLLPIRPVPHKIPALRILGQHGFALWSFTNQAGPS